MEPIKVFLDTNVVLDYLTARMGDGVAEKVMQVGENPQYKMCISFLTATNVLYLCRKYRCECGASVLSDLFTILPHTEGQWERAARYHWEDFEDVLQFICAIDAKCDIILSRDKHFREAPASVLSPEEFLRYVG